MKHVLVVGAGFAGAVYARTLADAGNKVSIIDRRSHIGGNCFDFVNKTGVRVHAYGPHLFHTKNSKVLEWLSQFGEFVPYSHEVRALLPDGSLTPLPINIDTVNAVFNTSLDTSEDMERFLQSVASNIVTPRNAADYLYSRIGKDLTELFFRPYTRKMWSTDLEDMSVDVVKRIPLKFNKSRTYFGDTEIQGMPRHGYTALFEKILRHPQIDVTLELDFKKQMVDKFDYCFNSMAIDEYFGYCFGELPYRSIRFHHTQEAPRSEQTWAVTNFTDDGPITRETAWHVIPNHHVEKTGLVTYTCEEPCDYRENNFERYYPIKSADGRHQDVYERYRTLALESEDKLAFIGRCGTYQYLDMDQVINQSLQGATHWLNDRARGPSVQTHNQ